MKDLPYFRSAKSALIGTLTVSLPLLLLSLSPLTGVYAVLLELTLLPTALCLEAAVCGLLPAAVSAAAGLYAMALLAGKAGLLLSAVYVLPIPVAFLLLIRFRVPFWKALGGMVLVHLLASSVTFLLAQRIAEGNIYLFAADSAVSALKDWELGDAMLYELYRTGILSLPDTLAENALEQTVLGAALAAEARNDLLLSVHSLVESVLKSFVPTLIVQQSILGGVGALLLPIRFGTIACERQAFKSPDPDARAAFPDLGMPPESLWYIPRGMGWKVGLALIGGAALQSLATGVPGAIAGVILYAAASSVFTVQGMALLNFMQKSKGTKRFWRVLVPVLLMAFGILIYLGIFDQLINIRGLRKPPEMKEE